MKKCKFTNCNRKFHAKGYCRGHYDQLRAGKRLTPIRRKKYNDVCTFDGCDKPHKAKGYCNIHYEQLRKGKKLTPYEEIYKYGDDWILNQRNLKEIIYCDPNEGLPHWIVRTSTNPRKQLIKARAKGSYMTITINGKTLSMA